MNHSKGSVSLFLLLAAVILLLIGQLVVHYVLGEYKKQTEYIHNMQLRALCISAAESFAEKTPEQYVFKTVFYPGNSEARLHLKNTFSSDGNICCTEVNASSTNAEQKVKRIKVTFDDTIKNMAQNYGVISSKDILGKEYLPAGILYTSNHEVILPAARSFEPWGINDLNMNTICLIGLCQRIYFSNDYQGIRVPAGSKIKGNGLIAAEGSITLSRGCKLVDEAVLISDGKIIIEDNAELTNVLLLAGAGITVGKNCKIKGIAVSGGNIEFLGPVDFAYDGEVMQDFTSIYYII